VLGGWWYWNTGYWYPAWGYDPYAWYPYDGPIYTGYANLTPDQVVVNVQVALRDQGYYAGAVDGAMGPQTRAALAAFQSDNGLAVTSAVDSTNLANVGRGIKTSHSVKGRMANRPCGLCFFKHTNINDSFSNREETSGK
jgi:hypothetical protein